MSGSDVSEVDLERLADDVEKVALGERGGLGRCVVRWVEDELREEVAVLPDATVSLARTMRARGGFTLKRTM